MTTYSSNLQTSHAWANSISNQGRNSNNSLNFRENVIYSYNTPMAEFIEDTNIVLLNTEKYSVTTSAHQSIIRNSIPYRYDIIEIPFSGRGNNLSSRENHRANFDNWENEVFNFNFALISLDLRQILTDGIR